MMKPLEIEAKSMEIIGQELKERLGCDPAAIWPEPELAVVKRCIHTSADFDYGDNLVFSKGGVKAGLQALKQGAVIVTDTNMAAAGINKAAAGKLGVQVMCFMADEDVAAWAKAVSYTHLDVYKRQILRRSSTVRGSKGLQGLC